MLQSWTGESKKPWQPAFRTANTTYRAAFFQGLKLFLGIFPYKEPLGAFFANNIWTLKKIEIVIILAWCEDPERTVISKPQIFRAIG